MKKFLVGAWIVVCAGAGLLSGPREHLPFVSVAHADTGDAGAFRIAGGSRAVVVATALNATTPATISGFRLDRPKLTCFNNSASYIFISSVGASAANLRASGFIILSSQTFSLGAHLGAVDALTNSGAGEARCWEGRTE